MRALSFLAAVTLTLSIVACAGHVAPATVRIAAPPQGALVAATTGTLAERAEACFADPACPLTRASRDLVAADDGGATDVNCFRFYYGTGVTQDRVRARSCFQRKLRGTVCDGSPELERVYLATMSIDGDGGPVDVAGAEGLLGECFPDVSVTGVREAKHGDAPVDFCRDIGGTTMSMMACGALDFARATFGYERWLKGVYPALGERGKALLRDADAAFAVFTTADSERAGDAFRGGSLSGLTYAGQRNDLLEGRVVLHEALVAMPHETPAAVRALESELAQKRKRMRAELDEEGVALFDASEDAFAVYVASEIAFCTDRGAAAEDVRALLLRDRVASLE